MSSSTRRHKMSPFVTIYDGFARNFDSKRAGAIIQATQDGKIPWILLRDYKVPPAEYREAAVMMIRTIRRKRNNFEKVAAARKHLGRTARIGVSLHEGEPVDKRLFQFIDYVFYSPIYRTTSKPGVRPVRKEGLQRFCQEYPKVLVYALGGITQDRVRECFEAGAAGIAVASGVTRASNILKSAHQYNRVIKSTHRHRPKNTPTPVDENATDESE